MSSPRETQTVLAIIKQPRFGVTDRGFVALSFNAMDGHVGALQIVSVEDAITLLKAAGVDDVRKLEGKAIWVEKSSSMMRYKEYADV